MWFLFSAILMTIPLAMIFMGQCLVKVRPRSKRCRIYYRTERSMRNTTTTRFAHQVCGKYYIWAGKWTMIFTAVIAIAFSRMPIERYETACGIWMIVETCFLLFGVFLTEKALSHRFGHDLV